MRPGLDEIKKAFDLADPYGVPTGVVPRGMASGFARKLPPGYDERTRIGAAAADGRVVVANPDQPVMVIDPPGLANVGFGSLGSDPVQQAVDDYLLMERKARAWDALRAQASKGHLDGCSSKGEALAYLDTFMRLDGAEL